MWWRDEILITKSPYRAHLSMPAGGVKRGEAPIDAACRELREEVGLRAQPADLVDAGLFVTRQQFKEDRAHVYELHLDAEPRVEIDHREIVAADFVAPSEAQAMHTSDILRDYLAARRSRDVPPAPDR